MTDKSIVPKHMQGLMKLDVKNVSAGESVFTPAQLQRLFMQTPTKHIHTLTKGGKTFNYVEGGYIRRQLDVLFGFDWDFEIIRFEREGDDLVCLGKLTGRIGEKAITKMQMGGAKIKYRKNSKDMLDYGNDCKAAATDALKKCAAEFGIARDVYYANEFVEAKIIETETAETEEAEKITEQMADDEKQAILDDLNSLSQTQMNVTLRCLKNATGKITIPKMLDDLSDFQWREVRRELNEVKSKEK